MTATTSNQAGGSSRARSRALGVALLSLLSFAVLSTALLGFEVFPQELAFDFSQIAYVIVPAGAGLAVIAAAVTNEGQSRLA